MGIFHKELDEQINSLISNLKKSSLQLPNNWHWLDYKTKAELVIIEKLDLDLAKKLNHLHDKGRDISPLSSQILQLSSELLNHLESIRKEKNIDILSGEGKRIKSIADEISQIYSREFSKMHQESRKLIYDNKVIQKFKKEIIEILNRKNVNWNGVHKLIISIYCTKSIWLDFTKDETNLLNLIKKGAKYEEYYNAYRGTLAKIESAKPDEMDVTKEGSSWFHIETSPEMPSKINYLGFSLKRYVTVDPFSIWDMLKYLLKLANQLRVIGLKNRDRVNVKIPASFLSFMNHTDSIVVHYHNHKIKGEIESTLQKWLSDYNIKTLDREYERAEHARDFIGTSFSDNIAQTVVNLMTHNFGKMSNEALAVSGINYGFNMSKG